MAPRKMELVVDLIRGRRVEDALTQLKFANKKAARILEKTLESAIANAQSKEGINLDLLRVEEARVDKGPIWKRFLPRAMGRATPIEKITSHVTVVLTDETAGIRIKE